MNKAVLLMGVVVLAGCSKSDPMAVRCPEPTVSIVQANQRFLDTVTVGQTPADGLAKLRGLQRRATLVKAGAAPMDVGFYQTGLPRCPLVMATESLTPVVVKDGVIVAYGSQTVRDMAGEGWSLKEAAWPWQRYDFGYLPSR